mmetsp:Transcript_12789/g.28255  ORF Transcript_12789/g.28255 Transcript_12789/m.28255 type:complete len:82 (-) Transcript_12789:286-531(-)
MAKRTILYLEGNLPELALSSSNFSSMHALPSLTPLKGHAIEAYVFQETLPGSLPSPPCRWSLSVASRFRCTLRREKHQPSL